jgi:hypothetical protein
MQGVSPIAPAVANAIHAATGKHQAPADRRPTEDLRVHGQLCQNFPTILPGTRLSEYGKSSV